MQNVSCTTNNTNTSCHVGGLHIFTTNQTYITTGTVLLCILIPVIVIGNVLVILAFASRRRLRTTTNYFVLSLAFADVMVGGLSLPMFTIFLNKGPLWQAENPEVTRLWTAIDIVTSIASIVNLMYISIDRYVCIQYPLRYRAMLTSAKALVMIAVSWLYGVLNYSLIQFTYRKNRPRPDVNLVITTLSFIVPLLVIIIMYGRIGKIALQHRIRILTLEEQQQSQNNENSENQGQKNKHTLWVLAELKATRVLAVVVGAFVLCFIGYFVFLLYTTICLEWRKLRCKSPSQEIAIVVQWIKYFNSSVNPAIYATMNQDMRIAMKRLVRGRLSAVESREPHADITGTFEMH